METDKPKPIIPASHAINWYIGNYIMDPDNGLRDDEALMENAFKDIEALKARLTGEKLTHKQLLDLMKGNGIHAKYYRYKKYEPEYCLACDKLGVPRNWR